MGELQQILTIISDFMKNLGELNKRNTSRDLKEILKRSVQILSKFKEAKKHFNDKPAMLEILDEGANLLNTFNKNLEELINISEENEKKYGADSEIILNSENCAPIKGIEIGCIKFQELGEKLVYKYKKYGLTIDN